MWDREGYYRAIIFLYSNSLEATHVYSSSKAVLGHCFKGTVRNDILYVWGLGKAQGRKPGVPMWFPEHCSNVWFKGQPHDNLFCVQGLGNHNGIWRWGFQV
jgi:hypothetical protein